MLQDIVNSILTSRTAVDLHHAVVNTASLEMSVEETIHALQCHPMLKVTPRGWYCHAWTAFMNRLTTDAKDVLIDLKTWTDRQCVPDGDAFAAYARQHTALFVFPDDRVRVTTTYNLINRTTTEKMLKRMGMHGMLRMSILCEYDDAHVDLAGLVADGVAWCTGNNVWHCSFYAAYADSMLPPLCSIVLFGVASGLCCVRMLAMRMQCTDLDIEFAIVRLVSAGKLHLIIPGGSFVSLAKPTACTSATDSRTSHFPRRPGQNLKKRRKRRSKRR